MRTLTTSTLLLLFGSVTLMACGSKDGGTTSGAASTSSAKSTTTSAPSGASSAKVAVKKGAGKGAKNAPKEKPATAKKTEVIKRDAGEIEKPMTKESGKLDDMMLKGLAAGGGNEAAPKKATDAPEDACKGIADNQAKCAGAKLLFCKGEEEFEINCDEDARMSGWVGGWCQESNDEVNCVNYAYDPNAPPPEDEINCAYDEEGMPYYCCTSISNQCWTP